MERLWQALGQYLKLCIVWRLLRNAGSLSSCLCAQTLDPKLSNSNLIPPLISHFKHDHFMLAQLLRARELGKLSIVLSAG